MTVEIQYALPNLRGVLAFCIGSQSVVARTLDRLYCINRTNGALRWEVELKGDHSFGYKSIVWSPRGVFLFTRHLAGTHDNILLEARAESSGELLWSKPIDWQLNNNYGGVQLLGDIVVVCEKQENQVAVRLFSLSTGDVQREFILSDVFSASSLPFGRQTSISISGSVYYCGKGLGIKRLRLIDNNEVNLLEFWSGIAVQLFKWEDQPAAVVYQNGELSALAFDDHGRIQKEWPLSANPAAITFVPPHGLVSVSNDGNVVNVFPPQEKMKPWSRGNSDWVVTNAVVTPFGLIVSVDSESPNYLKCFALKDGKTQSLPAAWRSAMLNPVFFDNNQCWIEMPEGFTSFYLTV